jgi:hypothetical protein
MTSPVVQIPTNTTLGSAQTERAPMPSTEALDSASVIEATPAAAAPAPPPAATLGAVMTTQPMTTQTPSNRPPAFAADPFRNVAPVSEPDDDLQVVKKKSGMGLFLGIGVVCIGILGAGIYAKFGMNQEDPKPAHTALGPATQSPTADIPPPPSKEEIAATTATAPAPAPSPAKSADPPAHTAKAETTVASARDSREDLGNAENGGGGTASSPAAAQGRATP